MIYQVQADNNAINIQNLNEWLRVFKGVILPERLKYDAYYDGKNSIIKQGAVAGRPNYSVNVNLSKYIVDVSTGYAFGVPITYTTKNEQRQDVLAKITDINKNCNINEVDFQQGGDMATYGVSYQLLLVKDGQEPIEDRITVKHLSPLQTFYVTDNTILEAPLCAVYFYNYVENKQVKTKCYVYDNTDLYIFDGFETNLTLTSIEPHNMGYIPILQSLNNDDALSDIFGITDLLDALSLAISNNTDDLQSIANAFLNVQGAILNEGGVKEVNETKVMNTPVGASVDWVIKDLRPEALNTHIDNLLKFLFQISQVPDLTDDAFGGNQSGVAMAYKLWGLNQLWVTKTSKYEKTVYNRLKIILHLIQYQIGRNIDLLNDIEVSFAKNLPTDNSEVYQMVQALHGVVSDRTLLKEIPIVEDVEAELEELDKQAEKQADTFGFNNKVDEVTEDGI